MDRNAALPRRDKKRRPARRSIFLALPRELRNCIYLHALCLPHRTDPFFEHEGLRKSFLPPAAQLCRVNRQVHREATEAMYSQNTFHFADAKAMLWFCARIGPRNTELIRSLSISVIYNIEQDNDGPHSTPWDWASTLAMVHMKSLHSILVAGENLFIPPEMGFVPMISPLKQALKLFLERQIRNKPELPALTLTGFPPEAASLFAERSRVTIKHWPEVEAVLAEANESAQDF